MLVQDWTMEQLVKVRQYQPILVDRALEHVLTQQKELLWLVVVSAYMDEKINLGKAAELLGLHRLQLQQRFMKQGIPLRLGSTTLDEAKAELAAIISWETDDDNFA